MGKIGAAIYAIHKGWVGGHPPAVTPPPVDVAPYIEAVARRPLCSLTFPAAAPVGFLHSGQSSLVPSRCVGIGSSHILSAPSHLTAY